MPVDVENYLSIKTKLQNSNVTLIAVSKTKPIEDILTLYNLGHRDFGENYVQELLDKQANLPKDIHWHFIGHLQTNKVKYIVPFAHLIHGVDSLKLLKEINKQAEKNNRTVDCLLQMHIAKEETKFGFDEKELNAAIDELTKEQMNSTRICGLMGMASFTGDRDIVRQEFRYLKSLFDKLNTQDLVPNVQLSLLSMGMSGDYSVAVEEGSTLVRIGSLLFGERSYNK